MFHLENQTQLNIFREIWIRNQFTRNYIKETLCIDKSTVTRNFNSMIDENIFYETNEIAPGKKGGRKIQEFRLNDELCTFISIAVIDGHILALFETLTGNIIQKAEKKVLIQSNETFIKTITELIDEFASDKPEQFKKLLSIDLALPGLIDSKSGIIRFSSDMKLNELNIVEVLERRYQRHIHVENDANAAAANSLFQSRFSDEKSIYFLFFMPENLLSLKEIGAGIIIDSKLYKGDTSSAGEVRIKNYWMLEDLDLIESTQLEKLDEQLLNENRSIRNYICNFSERIASVMDFMDPKKIILDGDIGKFSDFLRDYTLAKIIEYSSSKRSRDFIQIDHGGIESVAKGSTISFMISFFDDFEMAKKILRPV